MPLEADAVEETRAISTGSRNTVARREVRLMMATVVTSLERSYGVCQVKMVMTATRKTRATATA